MTHYYPLLRSVHITCAILSIALFVLRGSLMLANSPWRNNVAMRRLPHAVDTLLLATALMLTAAIGQYPFTTAWLTAKVLLLVIYVVLGSIALKRGRTRRVRIVAFAAAIVTVAFLVTVARTHSPLGLFAAT